MPPYPPQGAGYLTLLSPHSLGNATMVMLLLLSLRWEMKFRSPLTSFLIPLNWQNGNRISCGWVHP
ncbi:MAG: hypothetical protein WBI82_01495 [Sphaerochaeta sp.]